MFSMRRPDIVSSHSDLEPVQISSARDRLSLPMFGAQRFKDPQDIARRYNYPLDENGRRVVEKISYSAICVCDHCIRADRPPIEADNYPDAVRKMIKIHNTFGIREMPKIRAYRPPLEQPKKDVSPPQKGVYSRRDAERTFEPFKPPHTLFANTSKRELHVSALDNLLMKGVLPEYIRQYFTTKSGRATETLAQAQPKPIIPGVLRRLLYNHGPDQIEAIKKCYLVPDDLLQKIREETGI